MLDKKRIEEVLMRTFHLPSSSQTAAILATQMGLPAGSVKFAESSIDIADPDSAQVLRAQYTPEGGIAFID
jgi:hypothetical protein